MSVTAFNRRRRELAAVQNLSSQQKETERQEETKRTVKGGQKKHGKVRKAETDSGH